MSWMAGSAAKPDVDSSSDWDTAMERLSEVVTWWVLEWFASQKGLVYDVLGAVALRTATAPATLCLGNGGSYR